MLAWRPIGQVISKVWYIKICKPLFAWKPANLKAGQMFSWPMGGLFHLARGAPASPRRLNPRSILLHLPVLHHDRVTMEEQWKYFFGWKYWFYTNCKAWSNSLPTRVRVTHRHSKILSPEFAEQKKSLYKDVGAGWDVLLGHTEKHWDKEIFTLLLFGGIGLLPRKCKFIYTPHKPASMSFTPLFHLISR